MSRSGPRKLDLAPGHRSGKLTLVSWFSGKGGVFWNCVCDCGNEAIAFSGHIRNGARVSCGCANGEKIRTHGMTKSPEYQAWRLARDRCHRPESKHWKGYGGRGITMCERWRDAFENFLADMGRRPGPEYSLDRTDNNGPYSPANCRWATSHQQMNNRRGNRHLLYMGERMTLSQAIQKSGLSRDIIINRLERGITTEGFEQIKTDARRAYDSKPLEREHAA